jgi:hypothetical protein
VEWKWERVENLQGMGGKQGGGRVEGGKVKPKPKPLITQISNAFGNKEIVTSCVDKETYVIRRINN